MNAGPLILEPDLFLLACEKNVGLFILPSETIVADPFVELGLRSSVKFGAFDVIGLVALRCFNSNSLWYVILSFCYLCGLLEFDLLVSADDDGGLLYGFDSIFLHPHFR